MARERLRLEGERLLKGTSSPQFRQDGEVEIVGV